MTSPIVSTYGLGPSVFAITDDAQFEAVYHDCFGRDIEAAERDGFDLAYRSTPEFILDVYEMKWF